MYLSLLLLRGKPQGKEFPVRVSPFLIGRGPECHLRPNSDMVSRIHCAITIQGEEVRIQDLGSTNGTIVDGERLSGILTLTDGDIFQVGPLAFQVVIRRVAADAQPAVAAPAATPLGPAAPAQVTNETTMADDVAQWLVSDSKNEIPSSGSGEVVPLANTPEAGAQPADASADGATPPPKPAAERDRAKSKTGPGNQKKSGEATEAAAHAAENLIRSFMKRHPRP